MRVCRLVSRFRRWLEREGGGGPMAGMPLPPMERRKEVLLDRWHSHTQQCKTCQRVRCPEAALPCPALHGRLRHAAGLPRICTLLLSSPILVPWASPTLPPPCPHTEGKQPDLAFGERMTSRLIAQGFKLVKAAQLAMVALAAVLAWGLAAALGQGVAPVSKASACILVGEC